MTYPEAFKTYPMIIAQRIASPPSSISIRRFPCSLFFSCKLLMISVMENVTQSHIIGGILENYGR